MKRTSSIGTAHFSHSSEKLNKSQEDSGEEGLKMNGPPQKEAKAKSEYPHRGN